MFLFIVEQVIHYSCFRRDLYTYISNGVIVVIIATRSQ